MHTVGKPSKYWGAWCKAWLMGPQTCDKWGYVSVNMDVGSDARPWPFSLHITSTFKDERSPESKARFARPIINSGSCTKNRVLSTILHKVIRERERERERMYR